MLVESHSDSSAEPARAGLGLWLAALIFAAIMAMAYGLVRYWRDSTSDVVLGQPRVERAAQQRLPHSEDPLWATLRTTQIHEDMADGLFTARFSPSVQSLVGRTISIQGFMLPLKSRSETHHFLLSKYTPVCFFCPPGQPNEVIEVFSAATVAPTTDEVTVTGRFGLQKDGGMGLFYRLDNADVG